MSLFHLVVPGKAVGKGRPRARLVKVGGGRHAVTLYTPSKTRQYERQVEILARAHIKREGPSEPLECPLHLNLLVSFRRPKSVKPTKRAHPTVTPDLDNIVKSVTDALESAGVFKSDAQIVSMEAVKRYVSDRSGVEIWLRVYD